MASLLKALTVMSSNIGIISAKKRLVLESDIPPMSDIVENNKTGLVIDPHNERKWADAIIELIKNQQEYNRMGENGNEILRTKYNQELFYEKLVKMYKDVLTKSP